MNYATTYPRLWRLFFGLSATVVAWSIGYDLFYNASGGALKQILSVVVGVGSLIPLQGYVWQSAHRPRWLWRAMFWFSIVAISLALAAGVIAAVGPNRWPALLLLMALLVPGLIYLFALEQYLNKSPHIWAAANLGNEPTREA